LIDDYVHLGSGVHVVSGGHGHFFSRTDVPIALQGGEPQPVRIGYGSWIGNRAIVLADVGEECVIGAGSVVTRPIPPWSVAVGSPARVVSTRGCAREADQPPLLAPTASGR
jgi:acetyltransferase-like isoleucine patch superfamily enzyme